MKKLQLFEEFIAHMGDVDMNTITENVLVSRYLSGNISERQFNIRFDNQLNENIADSVKSGVNWLKDKFFAWSLGVFKSIFNAIKYEGELLTDSVIAGAKKALGLFKTIVEKIKNFAKKHPTIFKMIIILLVVMIIIIATTTVAAAQTAGVDPASSNDLLNVAIGSIDYMTGAEIADGAGVDFNDMGLNITSQAKVLLTEMRDGAKNIDGIKYAEYTDQAVELAKTAMNNAHEMLKGDGISDRVANFMSHGEDYVIDCIKRNGDLSTKSYGTWKKVFN